MAASVFAVVESGDEVVLLDPAYETYEACVILAGGIPRYVALDPPHWSLDVKKLENAFGPCTKAIIVNSPHNPTGKVFSHYELGAIAALCCKYDCLAITDEVYEHITFEESKHISLASFPGMQQRTIVTSSLSKTFSVTGWRVGWAIAPAVINAAIQNIHVKLTDSAPAPFQEAALVALQSSPSFYAQLQQEYKERRDFVCNMLVQAGFSNFLKPQGSFFVFAQLPDKCPLNDWCVMQVDYVAELIKEAGVAIVPGCGFFHQKNWTTMPAIQDHPASADKLHMSEQGLDMAAISGNGVYLERFVRVAFCKDMVTLMAADAAIKKHSARLNSPSEPDWHCKC
ncbi:hypothetical protein CY35_05G003000 [Sphagnum magellanicum]|nr:hypothetical protein CY35_05G003000 [Sphagnum magellanicum]